MKKLLIGLGSRARIGKDFAAQQLKQYYDIERIAFADELKFDIGTLFNVRDIDFNAVISDPVMKEIVRPLLVSYGQTMRKFKQNIWVEAALAGKVFSHQLTIITDVRFPNEVEYIHNIGGIYIEIETTRPPVDETEALYSPQMAQLADIKVSNNFDGLFISDMKKVIDGLLAK